MALFDYIKFTVLLFSLAMVGLAQYTSTPSNQNMTMIQNLTSCNSDLRIHELAVEDILRHAQSYTTHVVEITVSVNSGNKTREFKWSWADEIGRTIISLKALSSFSHTSSSSSSSLYNLGTSSFHYITLNAGVKEVNVVVENHGCLPNGSNGSEIIFDFLLHKIFPSGDTHDYKLCHVINGNDGVKQYNCCKIASGGNLTICAEYLSVLLEYVTYYITSMILFMLYVGFPLIMQYLRSIPKETQYYSITDSPMAVSTILYVAFLEESNNRATPYCRRLIFSSTVVTIIYIGTASLALLIVSIIWAVLFTVYDFFGLNTNTVKNIEAYLTILTLAFNIKYWWKYFEGLRKPACLQNALNGKRYKKIPIFIIAYILLFIPIVSFSISTSPITYLTFSAIKTARRFSPNLNRCKYITILLLHVLFPAISLVAITLFLQNFFNLLLHSIIGLYLNGSFFSPIVVPMGILVVYSCKNWGSFVETKYLELKTGIYECCEEYYQKKNSEKKEESNTSIPTTSSLIAERNDEESEESTGSENTGYIVSESDDEKSEESTGSLDEGYTVNVKKGKVSKALYHKIREHKLPYNAVLFYFFLRMFFVANFCLIVFVMMSLAEESNIAVPVQIMSTIAVSTLPLIFDMIWADYSLEQKNVNHKKLKQEINSIITMEIKGDGIVAVELTCGEKITRVKDAWRDIAGRDPRGRYFPLV